MVKNTTAGAWANTNSYSHTDFEPRRLSKLKRQTVSVCLPTREVAETIGPIVDALLDLGLQGLVDEIVVVDSNSSDGSAEIAKRHGATVYQEDQLLAQFGPTLGKGDAMWRGLSVTTGELVCFIDADTADFSNHFVSGLLGPLIVNPKLQFVKAYYARPFRQGGVELPEGGGRVTELTAKPLLRRFYPWLSEFRQPLAGEIAAQRSLLESLEFEVDYAVEIAMLIDVLDKIGIEHMAQVDLGERVNKHQPLSALGPMADSVLRAVTSRAIPEHHLQEVTRPPLHQTD